MTTTINPLDLQEQAMTRDPAAKEGKGITPGPLYMMKALQIAGAIYVREEDCRASVNEALKITAADRDRLRERVKELAEMLKAASQAIRSSRHLMHDEYNRALANELADKCDAALSKSPK